MKHLLLWVLFFVSAFSLHAQTWVWATASTSGGGEGYEVAADDSGNVFISGNFATATLGFGPILLNNTAAGTADAFLAKFDFNGNPVWAHHLIGPQWDDAKSVAADDSGNVYLTGVFSSDTLIAGNDTLFNSGGGWGDVFLVKFNPAGTVLWAISMGGTGQDLGSSVTVDANSGRIIVAGSYSSTSFTAGTFVLSSGGSGDVFVASCDLQGNVVWVNSGGGSGSDAGYGVTTDLTGNIFITGYISATPAVFGSVTLTAPPNALDMFVVKYDGSGNALWGKNAGNFHGAAGYDASADASGNVFVTGYYDSTITFGTYTLTTTATTASDEAFVVKYDASGNEQWALTSASPANHTVKGYTVATDGNGNAYVAGGRMNTAYTIFAGDTFNIAGPDPMFLVKLDPAGNLLCSSGLSSGGDDNNSVCVRKGKVFVGGDFIGNMPIGNDTLIGLSGENIFAARYTCDFNSIEENPAAPEILFFPNPSNGNFTISGALLPGSTLEIFDGTGKLVSNTMLQDETAQIDIGETADGIYFCRIVRNGILLQQEKILVIR